MSKKCVNCRHEVEYLLKVGYTFCSTCARCSCCGCRCKTCPVCGARKGPKHWCKTCKLCHKRCTCRKIPQALIHTIGQPHRFDKLLNPLGREIGLEVELSNAQDLQSNYRSILLNYHRDGSIDGSNPVELSILPMCGDKYINTALDLLFAFTKHSVGFNRTCGFHVHVNAVDYGPLEIRRLLRIYSVIEESIFAHFVAPHRGVNKYCSPLVRPYEDRIITPDGQRYMLEEGHRGVRLTPHWISDLFNIHNPRELQSAIDRWLYFDPLAPWEDTRDETGEVINAGVKQRVPIHRNEHYASARYAALNIHSLRYRGTVEWRHAHVSTEPEFFIFWPLLCAWVVELGAVLTDTQARGVKDLKDLIQIQEPKHVPEYLVEWVLGRLK